MILLIMKFTERAIRLAVRIILRFLIRFVNQSKTINFDSNQFTFHVIELNL